MRIPKEAVPVRLDAPGAVARQIPDFGSADGTLGAEYFSLAAGTDMAPLFVGLHDDACQAPHWGYVIAGDLEITYTDGAVERCFAGDLFYWPAGHSVKVHADAELVMFSPQVSHGEVLEHVSSMLASI